MGEDKLGIEQKARINFGNNGANGFHQKSNE